MKYKAVIFDFDDTIVQTKTAKWNQHRHVAKQEFDIDLDDETLAKYWGKPYYETLSEYYQHRQSPEILHKMKMHYESLFPVTLTPGFNELLDSLHTARLPICIVSSSQTDLIISDLTRLSINTNWFLAIQGSDHSTHNKPDPRVFDDMLMKLDMPRSDVVYIGDSLGDCSAAVSAGMGFIGFDQDGSLKPLLPQTIFTCDSMHAITKVLGMSA